MADESKKHANNYKVALKYRRSFYRPWLFLELIPETSWRRDVGASKEFAGEMEKKFAEDLAESDEIRLNEWRKRPLIPRIREWIAHRFKRWL